MWTRVWQFACRVEDIPEVGDSLVYDILDYSFVIVRSEDKHHSRVFIIHAFIGLEK